MPNDTPAPASRPRARLIPALRGLPAPLWVLAASTFINRFGGFVMVFLVIYMRRLGYSPTEAGAAVGAYAAGKLLAGPLGGQAADRLGIRFTMAVSMYGSAASMLLLWRASGYVLILAAACLSGLLSEMYRPATTAAITGAVAAPLRVTAFGLYQAAVNAGQAAGPAVAGLLATHSYGWLFIGDAATSVAGGTLMLALFLPRAATDTAVRADARTLAPAELADRRRRAGRLFLATVLVNIVLFQAQSTFPLWVTGHGHTAGSYGLLLSASAVLTLLFQLPVSLRTARFRPPAVIAAASLLTGAGFSVLLAGGTMPVLVLAVSLWSIGDLAAWPVAASYLAELAPPGRAGRWAGTRSLAYGTAMLGGPLLGTTCYEWSPTLVWAGCLACGALAALAIEHPSLRRMPGPYPRNAASQTADERGAGDPPRE